MTAHLDARVDLKNVFNREDMYGSPFVTPMDFQILWHFGDQYFSESFRDRENYTEKLFQAVFHYELSLSLTSGNWEKSSLKKT